MGHYSDNPASCEVNFFKESGKWYCTEAVDFTDFYDEPIIHDAFQKALARHFGDKPRLVGMIAVCLNPYHRNEHPIMVKVERA